jgi:hypothetical protein
MDIQTAYDTLHEIMERQYNYYIDHDPANDECKKIIFRYMVHAQIVLNRLQTLHQQTGRRFKADGNNQFQAHLLTIFHLFYKTYQLYNPTLANRAKQHHIQATRDSVIKFVLATIALRMTLGPKYKFADPSKGTINQISKDFPHWTDNNGPMCFLKIFTVEFNTDYMLAFKAFRISAMNCNVKTKRCTLFGKKKYAIHDNTIIADESKIDLLSSSSANLFYNHYRVCDLLWEGFEQNFLHNSKNVPGIPSNANCYNATERFILLSDGCYQDMMIRDDQLWVLFPNGDNTNQNPWI